MTELSQEALYNLCYSAIAFGDSMFELWLSVTFAAILAVYFSSERITSFMRRLLVALYAGTSVLLTGRWLVAMGHILEYRRVLQDAGFAPFPSPPQLGFALGVLHLLMFSFGSIATLYFMNSFDRIAPDD